MTNMRVFQGRAWKTPLTAVPLRTVGTARLHRVNYRGIYHMNGVDGSEFYRAHGWMPVTVLQQRTKQSWKTWMVDDPVHWLGMREAVEDLPSGKILVAGLGLGLMLHHMATEPRFTAITVVERNPDVTALIRPTLPTDDRVAIISGNDFYDHLHNTTEVYDGILWDLAVGTQQETVGDFTRASVFCHVMAPESKLVRFGLRRPRKEVVA